MGDDGAAHVVEGQAHLTGRRFNLLQLLAHVQLRRPCASVYAMNHTRIIGAHAHTGVRAGEGPLALALEGAGSRAQQRTYDKASI